MNLNDWLRTAQKRLETAGITTARLDSLVLLEDQLQLDRAYLLTYPEALLSAENEAALDLALQRREKHEPLAYIRGFSEFYGRKFVVNAHVLEPRPESETIIELLKKCAPGATQIADIGTGSGALAITAQLELPGAAIYAVDIDKSCLQVLEINAALHNVRIAYAKGDLLEPFLQKSCNFVPDVLLANLPYVPQDYKVNDAARHEPAVALFGGADGLDLYRTMFGQIGHMPVKPTWIFAESLPEQHPALSELAADAGYALRVEDDFIQAFVLASSTAA